MSRPSVLSGAGDIDERLALGNVVLVSDEAVSWRAGYPCCAPTVEALFARASLPPWSAQNNHVQCAQPLSTAWAVAEATLAQLLPLLTCRVRGERFCDGHRANLLGNGYLRRWLYRLAQLR